MRFTKGLVMKVQRTDEVSSCGIRSKSIAIDLGKT
jgi:hypothetical protein